MQAESDVPTPYAVVCRGVDPTLAPPCSNGTELIFMTAEFYEYQMSCPDSRWVCPRCNGDAQWSDSNYEASFAVVNGDAQ